MRRTQNADDFLLTIRSVNAEYAAVFEPQIEGLRRTYAGAGQSASPDLDLSLEAHVREYRVNAFLAALNWRLNSSVTDGLPNLAPEAAVRSTGQGTIRRLEYLGFEGASSSRPLMVVETKRPSVPLPAVVSAPPASTYSEIVSRGLGGERLGGNWSDWLRDMRDYVQSVKVQSGLPPLRAVLTNGEWVIVFADPADAFLDDGTRSPHRIFVYLDSKDVEARYAEMFNWLEHSVVVGKSEVASPAELGFLLKKEEITSVMHGIRLRYSEVPGIDEPPSPVIKVAPILFVGTRFGSWIRVGGGRKDLTIPHESDRISDHLDTVKQHAQQLLTEVASLLGTAPTLVSLGDYYVSDAFASLSGIREDGPDHFVVVTGEATHYLHETPSVSNCPYHEWTNAKSAARETQPGPLLSRSVQPRAFFTSGEIHHCSHSDVAAAKRRSITPANRDSCGARSGVDGQAFCEIWRYETHLCCRTCNFERVCTKSTIFRLPCSVGGAP